jgi:hypothetical protein
VLKLRLLGTKSVFQNLREVLDLGNLMFGIVLPCLSIYGTYFLKPVLYGLHGLGKIG